MKKILIAVLLSMVVLLACPTSQPEGSKHGSGSGDQVSYAAFCTDISRSASGPVQGSKTSEVHFHLYEDNEIIGWYGVRPGQCNKDKQGNRCTGLPQVPPPNDASIYFLIEVEASTNQIYWQTEYLKDIDPSGVPHSEEERTSQNMQEVALWFQATKGYDIYASEYYRDYPHIGHNNTEIHQIIPKTRDTLMGVTNLGSTHAINLADFVFEFDERREMVNGIPKRQVFVYFLEVPVDIIVPTHFVFHTRDMGSFYWLQSEIDELINLYPTLTQGMYLSEIPIDNDDWRLRIWDFETQSYVLSVGSKRLATNSSKPDLRGLCIDHRERHSNGEYANLYETKHITDYQFYPSPRYDEIRVYGGTASKASYSDVGEMTPEMRNLTISHSVNAKFALE